jgi:recombination protein RecT
VRTDGSNQNDHRNNAIVEGNDKQKTLRQQIAKMAAEFERALPKAITVERMMRVVMTAISSNPKLAECEQGTFFGAMLTALQLGLEVNTPLGQAYLIPYKGKCTFQLGYQGMLELAYRSKEYRRIKAEVVYQGDTFSFQYGKDQYLKHIPCGSNVNPLYVYSEYELINGGYSFSVWTWEAIQKHAEEFSESYGSNYSPWKSSATSAEEMAKKTVLKSLLKYGPRSVEIAHATNSDEGIVHARKIEDDNDSFVSFEVIPATAETVPVQKAENGEKTAAPVPAGNGNGKPQTAGQTVAPASNRKPPETGKTNPPVAKNNNSLYPQDENERLEEQYRQQTEQPDLGPDWSKRD